MPRFCSALPPTSAFILDANKASPPPPPPPPPATSPAPFDSVPLASLSLMLEIDVDAGDVRFEYCEFHMGEAWEAIK